MAQFDVWAPRARTVQLVLAPLPQAAEGSGESGAGAGAAAASRRVIDMQQAAGGWWTAPGLPEWLDADYGYVLDGAEDTPPLPDPRSRRQPTGVHGFSRTDDPSRFTWTDGSWTGRQLAGAVIYELHIGTFTPEGTLDAALGKLEHLRGIGVDFVELLPVNGFNGTHNWGYDGVAWFTVHELYGGRDGGPEAYRRFVDACHAAGIGVIQDVVYNHLGPSGNYLPRFGPYLHDGKSNTWGESVNLDCEGSAEVRRLILDNALMWLRDFHVDGLRLDAVHALHDESVPHLLAELAQEVDALSAFVGRPLSLIAESDLNDPVMFTPREAGGYGLTGQWSDDYHHAVHVNLTGETTGYYADFDSLAALAKVLTRGFFHDGTYSSFRERNHGKPVDTATVATWRLVVANQNHDQIGNRAIGDRLAATLDDRRLAIAAVLTLLGPFTPMLFQGEEWAASTPWQFFTSHPEAELGEATAKGRIAEFARMGWDESAVPDPQDPQTFERSKLNWSEASADGTRHVALLRVYRALAELRRSVPEFTDPRFPSLTVEFDEDAGWFSLSRGQVTVLLNFADEASAVQVPDEATVLFESVSALEGSPAPVEVPRPLPAHAAVVFRVEAEG